VPIEDVLDAYIDFKSAVTLAWVLILIGYEFVGNRRIVPLVDSGIYLFAVWNGSPELDFCAVNPVASVQVVVAHPLQEVLQVTLIWLEHPVQDCSLMQQVGKPSHMHGVEHIDFQENLVSNTVSKEGNTLDERYVANVYRLSIVCISAVRGGEGVINGGAEIQNVRVDWEESA